MRLEKVLFQAASSFIFSAGAWLLINKYGLQLGVLMLLGFLGVASVQLFLCRWANRFPRPLVLGAVVGSLIPAVLIVGLIG